MSHLVANPISWFSPAKAHIFILKKTTLHERSFTLQAWLKGELSNSVLESVPLNFYLS